MKSIKDNIVILLTGTIKPNSFKVLAVKDPEVRRAHYISAIHFYLSNTDLKIIFAENSGELLNTNFGKYSNRIEFLSFISPTSILDNGKGRKELEIIEYVIKNSKFINSKSIFIKITGRLKVLNINSLIEEIIKLRLSAINIVVANAYKNKKMDSRFFCFSQNFWSYLNHHGQTINLSYPFEAALWNSIEGYIKDYIGEYYQFNQPLRISGVSGGFGNKFDDRYVTHILKRIKHNIKKSSIYRSIRTSIK